MEIAELVNLSPASSGISAAPDCAFKASYTEVGTTKQNQVRIVEVISKEASPRFVQRTLVRTEWSPTSVVLAAVQSFLSYSRWPGRNGVEGTIRRKADGAVPRRWCRFELPRRAAVGRRKHASVVRTLERDRQLLCVEWISVNREEIQLENSF